VSNLIYACWREGTDALPTGALARVADRIRPSQLSGHPHQVVETPREALCLTGPVGAAVMSGLSAHLGAFAGEWKDWHRPGSPVPDGTFALIRSDGAITELCSDFAGSRTIWYALTETRFFASTSQRALLCLLGDLDLNRRAFAWFLSSGTLGPTDAWDARLRRLPREARLTLDRTRWTVDLRAAPLAFDPVPMKAAECREALLEILRASVRRFDFTKARWALPLSGGYDCRFILGVLVESGLRPPTMTWGLASSRTQPGNDAFIAEKLAAHHGLPHDYLLTERTEDAPEAIVDRFLAASGGTTDQLFPYLDGLRMWAAFADQGVAGVIRGDEGFGWIPVKTGTHARNSVGLVLLSDFMDPSMAEEIADGGQILPEAWMRHPDESIPVYRDRLYHGYRIPIGLAALNDVKAPFVEIASPLLAREVLSFVRRMPDVQRTDKALFRQIATSLSPPLPYATMGADDDRNGYLRSDPYTLWFKEELVSAEANTLLPPSLQAELLAGLRGPVSGGNASRSMRAALKRIIPSAWVKAARAQMGPERPSQRLLALRAALASRMIRMLEQDARTLKAGASGW
jgi:hypothetical protein